MGKASVKAVQNSNLPSAVSGGRPRQLLRSNLKIIDTARAVYPVKTALQLVEITGCPLRTVERWLTGEVKIPSDAFVSLLHADAGREFLSAVMADAEPRWWMKLKAFFNAIDVLAMQRVTRRKLKEALDADYHFTLPHAALLQDEEFFSAQPRPTRGQDRAVVARKGR